MQLLGEALELRIDLHGGGCLSSSKLNCLVRIADAQGIILSAVDTALECAGSYHHYGAALFAKAQEESDVFGTSFQETAASPSKGAQTPAQTLPGKHTSICRGPHALSDLQLQDWIRRTGRARAK